MNRKAEETIAATQAIIQLIIDTPLSDPPTAAEIIQLCARCEQLGYDRAQQEVRVDAC